MKQPPFKSKVLPTINSTTNMASTAPKSLTRPEAMALLTSAGKHTEAQLEKMEGLDDETFEMFMPLAAALMKKTKAPAKAALTEEQKAQIVFDKKMAYLDGHITGGKHNNTSIAEELELLPENPCSYMTEEEWNALTPAKQKKVQRCSITNQPLAVDMDMEVYAEFKTQHRIITSKVQNAAYSLLLADIAKKPNRFLVGNFKMNAAGKMEKLGGKQEKTDDELSGEITLIDTKGKVQKKILQQNEQYNGPQFQIDSAHDDVNVLFRMKNCGGGSNQTAIMPYLTPYNPKEQREGGCGCFVYMKDVGEFMVKKTGVSTYEKVKQADALQCLPCFRICNRDAKDGTGRCGTHQRHASPSKKMLETADKVDFPVPGDGVWGDLQKVWYENY